MPWRPPRDRMNWSARRHPFKSVTGSTSTCLHALRSWHPDHSSEDCSTDQSQCLQPREYLAWTTTLTRPSKAHSPETMELKHLRVRLNMIHTTQMVGSGWQGGDLGRYPWKALASAMQLESQTGLPYRLPILRISETQRHDCTCRNNKYVYIYSLIGSDAPTMDHSSTA